MPHYRVAFFDRLRERLQEDRIELEVFFGQPDEVASSKRDTATIEWARPVRNRYIAFGGRQLIWQPVLRAVWGADLVIVEQASRLLINPVFASWRKLGGPRFALWGHGRNLDTATASRLGEWWKRRTISACDWWFAYTESTKAIVVARGFPADRITVVQNAHDTTSLARFRSALSAVDIQNARVELGIGSPNVGLYLGSLYEGKRLRFLILAADLVRQQLPDFALLIIGDGPDRAGVQAAACTRPWVSVLGTSRGETLARYGAVATVMLMPGLVGLAILDAFALETPMITSAVKNHSPEIEYMRSGHNGVVVAEAESPQSYADAVVSTLTDRPLLDHLRQGCRLAAQRYTVDEMVERFRSGVLGALSQ